jgi:hypothetical protein
LTHMTEPWEPANSRTRMPTTRMSAKADNEYSPTKNLRP